MSAGYEALATKAKATIVPLSIDGSYRMYEETGSINKDVTIRITVHEPVDTALLDRKESSLFSLNLSIIELFSNLAGITCNISLTEEYYKGGRLKDMGITDLRERIHPKYKGMSLLQELKIEKPYYQVFSDKQGFIPNLSMLDLLCNEGPNAISYLKAYSD